MKLFVDDLRSPEDIYPGEADWHVARTITEAIRILASQDISHVSIDHDIQCNSVLGENGLWSGGHTSLETYEPIAWYIATYLNTFTEDDKKYDLAKPCIKKITLHSANATGRKKMYDILRWPASRWEIPINELPGCSATPQDV